MNEFLAENIPEAVENALEDMTDYEFEQTSDAISHLDSEQALSEQIEHLNALAELTGRDTSAAMHVINERLAKIEEPQWSEERPSFGSRGGNTSERFDDDALLSLFSNLIET